MTQYGALHGSMTSRKRTPPNLTGADRLMSWVGMKLRHRRARLGYLTRESHAIDRLAPECRGLTEAALDEQVALIRAVFLRGKIRREDVRRAMALVREVARRETGEQAYPVQIVGALGLYHGRIVEMLTGEGKTLTGSIAAPLLAWKHRHLHIFTVNDYLARRDSLSRKGTYTRCLCAVGAIQEEHTPAQRAEIYARPIVLARPSRSPLTTCVTSCGWAHCARPGQRGC